jgi:hypothetical protein
MSKVWLAILISMSGLAIGCASKKPYEAAAQPPPIARPKVARIGPGAVIELKDGGVYRIKGLEASADARVTRMWAARLKDELKNFDVWGLRPVDSRRGGVQEAEIWSYPEPRLICGNTTKEELSRMQRSWYDVTPTIWYALGIKERPHPIVKAE